jgi:hypothetical protein
MVILYIALVFVIIGYLGAVLVAWQSIAKRDHITYIALIFVLLGAAGAIWVTIDTSRTTDQLVKKSDEIASLNREIANLNKTIVAIITGGDYHGELTVYSPHGNNEVYFTFRNSGKYPLYGVRVNIEDLDKTSEVLGPLFWSIDKRRNTSNPVSIPEWNKTRQQAITVIKVGDIWPSQAVDLGPIVIPNTDNKDYRITISAKNGSVVKLVKFKKIEGKWKMATRDYIAGEIFKESGDADFPRNKEGKIEW